MRFPRIRAISRRRRNTLSLFLLAIHSTYFLEIVFWKLFSGLKTSPASRAS
jgi:hypothetical protein